MTSYHTDLLTVPTPSTYEYTFLRLGCFLRRCGAPLSYFHAEYFTDVELFPTRRLQMYAEL